MGKGDYISAIDAKKPAEIDDKANWEIVGLYKCVYDGGIKINKEELWGGKFYNIEGIKELINGGKVTPILKGLFSEFSGKI